MLPIVQVLSHFTTLQQICPSPSLTPQQGHYCGDILQLDTAPHQEWHRFCSLLPPAPNSSNFPPDNLGRLRLTPQHLGHSTAPGLPVGIPSAMQGSCSSAVPCCPSHAVPDWQAACRGEGQSKAILNVKQAEKTLVPAFHCRH